MDADIGNSFSCCIISLDGISAHALRLLFRHWWIEHMSLCRLVFTSARQSSSLPSARTLLMRDRWYPF